MNSTIRKHFTLVESLVALVILGISVSAILSLITMATEMGDLLDRRQVALQLASKRIEKLRDEKFIELPLFNERDVRVNEDGNYDPLGAYSRTTDIAFTDISTYEVSIDIKCKGTFLQKETSVSLATALVDYSKIR